MSEGLRNLANRAVHGAVHGGTRVTSPSANTRWATAAAALFLLLCATGACGANSVNVAGHHHTSSRPSLTTTSGSRTTITTQPPAVATDGTFAVGTTSLNVVEPPSAQGEPGRTLPTQVWYPATSQSEGPAPDRTRAPYPLLVFSQGYDLGVSAYSALLEAWATAGYVVAAPTYPHTDPSDPAGLDENDIVNHPADLRYVITTVLDTAQQHSSVLSGLVAPNEIGVVGHSDGGDVSLAVAENTCCRDPRVKAAAILSGAELAAFGGTYFARGAANASLLVVQGNDDTINYPVCSSQIYDTAGPPKYYLDLLGAQHEPPYVNPWTYQQVIEHVVTDFFDAQLMGQTAAATAMASDGNVAGTTQLTDGATAPAELGSCPGAPS
jgi:predicted dienelactone hydrolase